MITEYSYINIKEILSRLLRHPLLQNITLEQVVQYTIDFIGTLGMPKMYVDKVETLQVKDYRTILPCDAIIINQVRTKEGVYLQSMTSTFNPEYNNSYTKPTFKTQGQILYTSFKEGEIEVSYKAIPIDKDGYPLLIDNPIFLRALESYIKKEVFTILFDMNKIQGAVLQNTQQQYAWLAGQMRSEFSIPSLSEMESIKNSWRTLIQRTNEFNTGFDSLNNQEFIKVH
jgi:hypothetical protein